MTRLDAALAYAERWPVFPCHPTGPKRKTPLTDHGFRAATTDPTIISRWWTRWPAALIGTPTGRGFVVLDIDPRHGGFETLASLGFPALPATPTAITGSDGRHLYFEPPAGVVIRNTQGTRGRGIGPGLDWRGVGGYVIVPAPGTGYEWDPATVDMPLAPIPPVLLPRGSGRAVVLIGTAATCSELSPYGEAALRSAAGKILTAPDGEQEATLNGEAFSIGRLAGCGGVPADLALKVLLTAALAIPNYKAARPWEDEEIEKKVRAAFVAGLARPRPAAEREIRRHIITEADWLDVERRYTAEAADVNV